MVEAYPDQSLALLDCLKSDRADSEVVGSSRFGNYQTLMRLVEDQVVPRLLLAHRSGMVAEASPSGTPDSATIVALTAVVLHQGLEEAYAEVATLIAGGMSLEKVFIDVLAPVADRIGKLWETDECSFCDVTLALCKLHRMVRGLSRHQGDAIEALPGYRVLIAAAPGNTHVLGVAIVEELFRRAGWSACALPAPTSDEILEAARGEWFAVAGLSVSCDEQAENIEDLIDRIRAESMNKKIIVLVGGRYFLDHPEEALRCGADATASDAREAIVASGQYVKAHAAPSRSR